MRGHEISKLDQLNPVDFKNTVLQMVATRDDTAWKRTIRNKPKLALYTIVCELEQHNEPGRKTLVPKQYLKIGNLTAPKRLKFSLRAGVAELQEEIERKSRGNRTRNTPGVKSCPFCPSMIENQAHFIVSCPQYDVRRTMLWEKLQGVIPITTVTSLKHLPAQQLAAQLLADTVGGSGLLSQSGGDLTAAALLVETFLWESWNIRKRLLVTQK